MIAVQVAQRLVRSDDLPHGDALAAKLVVPGGRQHLAARHRHVHFVMWTDDASDVGHAILSDATATGIVTVKLSRSLAVIG